MSLSPVSSKSIVFLLGLLYLQAYTVDASISTSAGFPQDVFAKPAFQVNLGSLAKDAPNLPIRRADALNILEQQEASSSSTSNPASRPNPSDLAHISSLAVPAHAGAGSGTGRDDAARTLFWSLQRSSPDDFQLCSIPDFTFTPADKHTSGPHHASASTTTSSRSKQDLIRNAQTLLDPLKKVCLYHTTDWFTYSFCHGREIRQFRRLGAHDAAKKAFKAAGGGEAGKKAAIEAADKVNRMQHPIDDPEFPAFILGRWTPQNEDIVGDDRSHQRRQQQPLSDATQGSTGVAVSANHGMPSLVNAAGLDLVEEVQFGDWDEEELFAAEAKALAQFKDPQTNAVEASQGATGSAAGHESHRHRYLTQRWTNGTMCDMNHQPRTVEVQFHCSNRKPLEDRIVMFKETTICNYVLVIETPRLCADPAFGSEKEEAPLPIQCHQVVDDNYPGPTVSDPDRVPHPSLSEIDDGAHVHSGGGESAEPLKSTTESSEPAKDQAHTASNTQQEPADEASSTSHTYGDLSQYGSVHDDYYDEALGGPGALYQQYYHDHDHDHDLEYEHDHEHHHDHELEEAELLVEIGVDQDGRVLVNKVIEPPVDTAPPADSKETRRRDSGKKRSDDDQTHEDEDRALEIQLDVDDFLSVLRGDEGGNLEKKLAEKISQVLNKQMQRDGSISSPKQKGEDSAYTKEQSKDKTPDDVAKLYQRLMSAVAQGAKKQGAEGAKLAAKQGQGRQQQAPPALRMEKVGDSLAERAKRFYDAKERESKGEQEKKTSPPPLAQHVEL